MTLTALHHRAIDLELAGHTAKEIATKVRRAYGTVRNWRMLPEYQKARSEAADDRLS